MGEATLAERVQVGPYLHHGVCSVVKPTVCIADIHSVPRASGRECVMETVNGQSKSRTGASYFFAQAQSL